MHKKYRFIRQIITYFLVLLMCLYMCFPVITMAGTAFKTSEDARSSVSIFPSKGEWYFGNFGIVMRQYNFGLYMFNSMFVSLISALLAMAVGAFAGYALSRYNTILTKLFMVLLLLLQMLPATLVLVPMFIIYRNLHLTNTHLGLILNYTVSNLGFSIWMLKGFFDGIPKELEEAAEVDGCGRFGAFLRVILPISATGFSTVAIFTFVKCWNEYMVARILISTDTLKTINLGLQQFTAQLDADWSLLSAASAIATIPTILFLIFAQKYLVRGITSGAVKG